MIEVLITMALMAFGLLGIAALQARMHVAEMEAHQRAHATMLLREMTSRLHANGKNALSYVTAQPLGTGASVSDCSGLTEAGLDLCEWSNALLGASEVLDGSEVGAVLGARGCIELIEPAMPRVFRVAVAWQGLNDTVVPQASVCGAGSYGEETKRRVIAAPVVIACLQNNPATGTCVTP
jgi:type IV pilus assembly protein PilV